MMVSPKKACGLLVDPARLPLAPSGRLPTAPAFLLFDFFGNSVPPKEPPSLRCKAPPPKCLATVVSEPDPNCFFTLLLFSRRKLQQRVCQHSDSTSRQNELRGFSSKSLG